MDSYSLCPCGSGKKLKFCCQAILPEMAKIERLQDNNQPRMALQIIDKLLKDHPDNAWLVNQRAMSLLAEERFEDARDGLVAFLRKNPDHPLSNGLLALCMTELELIPQCKKVIHRAFLKSMTGEPRIVAILAGKLVDYHLTLKDDMAARQHMAVILRLEREEERQRTMMAMLEMDSDTSIPYPLRGAHPLPNYQPSEALQAQFKKAQRLYVHACFAEAADLLDQIAEQDSSSPSLWQMIGLMRAWDGDTARAAAAFHRFATLESDSDRAIDGETIGQLLDRRLPENSFAALSRPYSVVSMSRLLTRFDNEDQLARNPLSDFAMKRGLVAAYEILDRPLPPEGELAGLTAESLPRSLGQVTLTESQLDGEGPTAHVNSLEGKSMDECVHIFERVAGELATILENDDEDSEDRVRGLYSKDEIALADSVFFPPKTPPAVRSRLQEEFIGNRLIEKWLNTPSMALSGKSPIEAAGDESQRIALQAAINVLDASVDRRSLILDRQSLLQQLHLESPTPLEAGEDVDLNSLSVPQLLRLQTEKLSDEAFDRLLQRAMVVRHAGLAYRLISEFLTQRPQLVEKKTQEAEQAYITISDICVQAVREKEALDWLQQGMEFSNKHGASFETQLMWKMRELSLRARSPEDSEFKQVLLELWNHYGSKLPAVRARLEEFVRALEIDAPWEHAILTPQVSAGGSVWTADTEQTTSSEKKLWLPD